MYIDADTIITAGSLVAALSALAGVIFYIYRRSENDKKQSEVINAVQKEQTLICYGLKCVLQGVIELGADGPCKDALNMLDKHLNKSAHKPEF